MVTQLLRHKQPAAWAMYITSHLGCRSCDSHQSCFGVRWNWSKGGLCIPGLECQNHRIFTGDWRKMRWRCRVLAYLSSQCVYVLSHTLSWHASPKRDKTPLSVGFHLPLHPPRASDRACLVAEINTTFVKLLG